MFAQPAVSASHAGAASLQVGGISWSRDGVVLHSPTATAVSKLVVLRQFWTFLRVRKKFWLAPIVLVLVLLGLLLVSVGGSPLAPFVYALF